MQRREVRACSWTKNMKTCFILKDKEYKLSEIKVKIFKPIQQK